MILLFCSLWCGSTHAEAAEVLLFFVSLSAVYVLSFCYYFLCVGRHWNFRRTFFLSSSSYRPAATSSLSTSLEIYVMWGSLAHLRLI
mmetsp:Transcript_23006/g.70692  ORF Transcript_23006/g.70692 Transcript_23006/m.70692 type:complete len:87 (+) Transcript_23006:503-763(+)